MAQVDPMVRAYFLDPIIEFMHAGTAVAEGPITEPGFYVLPFCHPMCCRPEGPFATEEEARAWARREAEEITDE